MANTEVTEWKNPIIKGIDITVFSDEEEEEVADFSFSTPDTSKCLK